MYNDQDNKNNQIRRRKMNIQRSLPSSISADISKHQLISIQIPPKRKQEILEYLKLFGYKPEKTILQVHIIGFFNKED